MRYFRQNNRRLAATTAAAASPFCCCSSCATGFQPSPLCLQRHQVHSQQKQQNRGGGGSWGVNPARSASRATGFAAPPRMQQQQNVHHESDSPQSSTPLSLEEKLQQRFGPHAKLVVRFVEGGSFNNKRDQNSNEKAAASDVNVSSEDASASSPPSSSSFKASVTFKQLGFPVEIATAQEPTSEAAERKAFEIAMDSNIVFMRPVSNNNNHRRNQQQQPHHRNGNNNNNASDALAQARQTVDDLRQLCQELGRALKFSVKPKVAKSPQVVPPLASPPSSSTAQSPPPSPPPEQQQQQQIQLPVQYGCRVYVRDDWSAVATLTFLYEAKSVTPNDALLKAFTAVRDKFRNEADSEAYVQDEYLEVERMLKLKGKALSSRVRVVTATPRREGWGGMDDSSNNSNSAEEGASSSSAADLQQQQEDGSSSGAVLYTVDATVSDANGNTYVVQAANQSTLVEAYRGVALQINDSESKWDHSLVERAPSTPMVLKLRFQVEGMVHHLVQMGQVASGAEGDYLKVTFEEIASTGGQVEITTLTGDVAVISTRPSTYRGTGVLDGKEVASSSGPGAYRVEFDVYVQLLGALIDRFPDIARVFFVHCYPTMEALERAAYHHDHYRMHNHKGKWTCYSVLGSITSTLLGTYYTKEFQDFASSTCRAEARVVINDGYQSRKLLARRFGNVRGYAYREAVMDAVRNNFPVQYEMACQHDEFDASSDSARGNKMRALPREKRVQHINQLFGVIGAFAEEDYGWTALRVRSRVVAGDESRWIAELEVQVAGERDRRVVACSPIALSEKIAKRLLVYHVCKQYFPKELETYVRLGRSDAAHPEAESIDIIKVYRPGIPFFSQILVLLDQAQPGLAPFTWSLERMPRSRNVAVEGGGVDDGDDDDDGTVESLQKPLYLHFKATVFGNNGETIVVERLGEENEAALAVVRSVLRAATSTYVTGPSAAYAEELWREFECMPPPPLASTFDLCQLLFQLSLGGNGGADGTSRDAAGATEQLSKQCNNGNKAVDVEFALLRKTGWWVATVILPNMHRIPIARAVSRSKRDAHVSAMIAACRQNFAKQVRYFSKQFIEAQAYADDIFHAPVMLSPPTAQADSSGKEEIVAGGGNETPHQFLKQMMKRFSPSDRLIVEQEAQPGGSYACRIYSQRGSLPSSEPHSSSSSTSTSSSRAPVLRIVKGKDAVEVGYGCAMGKQQALHLAALSALESLFPNELKEKMEAQPWFADIPAMDTA